MKINFKSNQIFSIFFALLFSANSDLKLKAEKESSSHIVSFKAIKISFDINNDFTSKCEFDQKDKFRIKFEGIADAKSATFRFQNSSENYELKELDNTWYSQYLDLDENLVGNQPFILTINSGPEKYGIFTVDGVCKISSEKELPKIIAENISKKTPKNTSKNIDLNEVIKMKNYKIESTTDPSNGKIEIIKNEETGEKTIKYTPNKDFTGKDIFTYTVKDEHGNEDTATVSIDVLDKIIAENISKKTPKNTSKNIDLNEVIKMKNYKIESTTDPSNGKIEIIKNEETGEKTIKYTPNKDFTGKDIFTYTVKDEHGNEDTATVSIDVLDKIIAENISKKTPKNTSKNIDLNEVIKMKNYKIKSTTDPSNGKIEIIKNEETGEKTIKYTPNKDFTGKDIFTYTVKDEHGNEDTATVSIDVLDKIIAENISKKTPKNTSKNIDLNEVIKMKNYKIKSTTDPSNGKIEIIKNEETGEKTIKYTPNKDFTGKDIFTYTVKDEHGNEDTATVSIDVFEIDLPITGSSIDYFIIISIFMSVVIVVYQEKQKQNNNYKIKQ